MLNKFIQILLLWAIVTANVACSYVADYIEGEITNRARFSISAHYEAGTGVIVEWDANPGNDSFAGYEIYMTQEPNNEYSDYFVIGAPYDIGTSSYFQIDGALSNSSTTQFIHTSLPPSGIYFYRVGVIEWDERDYNNDGEDEKKPASPTPALYKLYTNIAEISGSAMVEIP
ncbi:MAG TPA: hypothetical protein PK348_05100 [Spirochaetota bacterium]|nr:hypothetical protein [Spirochaetota bacterium]